MSFFTWDEKYSVQVAEMDDQHKRLFEIIADLHQAMSQGKGNTVMADILKKLQDYTVTHFKKEEEYMQKFGYSGLAEQKKQHTLFIQKLSDYQISLSDKKLGLSIEVMTFLKDWLITHIQQVDTNYSETFHSHNLS